MCAQQIHNLEVLGKDFENLVKNFQSKGEEMKNLRKMFTPESTHTNKDLVRKNVGKHQTKGLEFFVV